MLCKIMAQPELARSVVCGEHPLVEILRMAKPNNSTKTKLKSFTFLPLSLWRKQNVLEGTILAYFCPPKVLFF